MASINYKPPPTLKQYIRDYLPGELFYDWIVGPVGSGKTTAIFMKLVYMAGLQAPGPDGVRRTRAVIVRNTMPQLRDTTLSSWNYWFKDGQAGTWRETDKKFTLRFGDIECEVLFRPLDTPEDVARVLSLEVTFAIIDEFVEIPRQIIDALSARCGRYPSKVDGGATNWGMWGSSNPSTEDNWWFDYLHKAEGVVQPTEKGASLGDGGRNTRYFLQPSGFSDEAENIENLPGGQNYYHNQAKNKSDAWIKQFLEACWGFSVAGKPVVPTFNSELHISKTPLKFMPHRPLIVGFDPGLGGSAFTFCQEDLNGRLLILAELVQQGYGTTRLVQEKLRPFLRAHFPDADVIIAPDPAAGNRAQNDERTAVDILKKYFKVRIETNNRLPLRLDAIEHYTTRLTDLGPALQIDPQRCPLLIRALKGGWRYTLDKKEEIKGHEPEKNSWSHSGDSFGYAARFFHRQALKDERYAVTGRQQRPAVRSTGGSAYHMR